MLEVLEPFEESLSSFEFELFGKRLRFKKERKGKDGSGGRRKKREKKAWMDAYSTHRADRFKGVLEEQRM